MEAAKKSGTACAFAFVSCRCQRRRLFYCIHVEASEGKDLKIQSILIYKEEREDADTI